MRWRSSLHSSTRAGEQANKLVSSLKGGATILEHACSVLEDYSLLGWKAIGGSSSTETLAVEEQDG